MPTLSSSVPQKIVTHLLQLKKIFATFVANTKNLRTRTTKTDMTNKRLIVMLLSALCATMAWSADWDTFSAETQEGVAVKYWIIS